MVLTMVFGDKNNKQQKPSALQLLQQLMMQHNTLYQMEIQLINELKNFEERLNIPDYNDNMTTIINEVRNLQGLVKGVNADTRTINEKIERQLQLLQHDIKPNIDTISGNIAGMQGDFEEKLSELQEVVNQLNQAPAQLGEALNSVLENFQENLNTIIENGLTDKLEKVDTNTNNIQEQIESIKEALTHLTINLQEQISEQVENMNKTIQELNTLKEVIPEYIGKTIDKKIEARLKEFDTRISNMEEKINDIYKLFFPQQTKKQS